MSILRNIFKAGITGPVVKSVAAPIYTPEMVPDHALQLIAEEPYVSLNNDRIKNWEDIDDRFDFTQGTNSIRPFFGNGRVSPNGKDCAYWNGGKRLNLGNYGQNYFIDKNVGQTIVFVGGGFTNNNDTIFAKYEPNSNNRQFRFNTNSYTVQSIKSGLNLDEVASFTKMLDWHVYFGRWIPGVQTAVFLDGSSVPIAEAAIAATDPDDVTEATKLCSDGDGNFSLNVGYIGEFVIYRRPLTDGEMWKVAKNLYNRWILT